MSLVGPEKKLVTRELGFDMRQPHTVLATTVIRTRDGSDVKIRISTDARIRMRIPAREAPRMRIQIRMPVQEDPRMRILMRMPVSRYPRMRKRMRIFVTYLNNTSYCQMGAPFVTEYS